MFNLIEETIELSKALNETEPHVIFAINSLLNIPYIYNRRHKMLDEAKRLYANGELIKDGSRPRTLGGCWFVQLQNVHIRMSEKIRRYYRQDTCTPRDQIPTDFLKKLH